MKKLSVLISFIAVLSLSLSAEKLSDLKSGKHVLYVEEQKEGLGADEQHIVLVKFAVDTLYGLSFDGCIGEPIIFSDKEVHVKFHEGTKYIKMSAVGYGQVEAELSEALIGGKVYRTRLQGCQTVEITLDYKTDKAPIAFDMVLVKGGSYIMGLTEDEYENLNIKDKKGRFGDAKSRQCKEGDKYVNISSDYYIGKCEVTEGLWKYVMGDLPDSRDAKGDNYPVVNMTWLDAYNFTQKLSETTGMTYRLPTEAEWEFAARGGGKNCRYAYSGSDDINSVAWWFSTSGGRCHEVGGMKPNELGIYDMCGNVYEMCLDNMSKLYDNEDADDPVFINEDGTKDRVRRGGAYSKEEYRCNVAYRRKIQVVDKNGNGDVAEKTKFKNTGLRLVLEAEPNEKLRSILGNND